MKILVYGGRGWIGDQMVKILKTRGHNVILGSARLNNYGQIETELSLLRPERVFSSTGRTHGIDTETGKVYGTIDYLELPGNLEVNIRDNLCGPVNLAMACQRYKIHLTYIGTGCIFTYDWDHLCPSEVSSSSAVLFNGFREEDLPNFTGSGYSTVKGQTDMLMKNFPKVLNCRIRMPITANNHSRNFITKIINYEKICSIPNSMTVLHEILPIIAHMIETETSGTFNMTNPGWISHNQILDLYKEKIDSEFKYTNFTLEEQARVLLSGRSNNYLETTKLENYCQENNLPLNPILGAVKKVLDKWSSLHGSQSRPPNMAPL